MQALGSISKTHLSGTMPAVIHALVAAELVGANSGLGFLINDARTVLRTDYILDGMLAIGLIGLTLDRLIRYAAKKFMPWSRALNA